MIFHADSESDLKTTPNHVKNPILSKTKFLWYFDLKFPLRNDGFALALRAQGPPGVKNKEKLENFKFPVKNTQKTENQNFKNSWHFRPKFSIFFLDFKSIPGVPGPILGPLGDPGGPKIGQKISKKFPKNVIWVPRVGPGWSALKFHGDPTVAPTVHWLVAGSIGSF